MLLVERNLDFDTVIDRRNTSCLKHDFTQERGMPKEVLPLWVADMDFKTSSIILDILKERIAHGVFGYTETKEDYFSAVAKWMKEKHNWQVDRHWLIKTPGVVVALAMAVKAYTKVGDFVLIQQPVYYPFREVIEDNDRIVANNELVLGEDGKYHMDLEDFERKIIEHKIRLFILCSPHNPVGRVWTKEELLRLGEICLRHHVIVVSDEIHADFTYGENRHLVFADLKPDFAEIAVTCTSPGKTFNLAGLQVSNIFISNRNLKEKFKKQVNAMGYSQLNTMGIMACHAAYSYGDTWYRTLMKYLQENIDFVRIYLKEKLPQIKLIEPEGTYLVWLDFRELALSKSQLEDLIVHSAKLWLDQGTMFGKAGEGFERINIACPKVILEQAMDRLYQALTRA